jgi:UDP-sugar transporter A1/2/3
MKLFVGGIYVTMLSLIKRFLYIISPKWLSLLGFMIQSSLVILILKSSNIYSNISIGAKSHIISTTVVITEILKLILSSIACYVIDSNMNYMKFKHILIIALTEDSGDCLKLFVPAFLYTIQNNLQYIIEEAPLFLVLYNLKIITTAIFYSTLLSRRLSTREWSAIALLAMGVSMVESSQLDIVPHHASDVIGILSVIIACLTSGNDDIHRALTYIILT